LRNRWWRLPLFSRTGPRGDPAYAGITMHAGASSVVPEARTRDFHDATIVSNWIQQLRVRLPCKSGLLGENSEISLKSTPSSSLFLRSLNRGLQFPKSGEGEVRGALPHVGSSEGLLVLATRSFSARVTARIWWMM
jgi:hypothetical protein